jgi:UDP-N-acetylglucosamine 2-epimerase
MDSPGNETGQSGGVAGMILSVIGARPQFIKAAVVSRALAAAGIAESVVHTGQHYDDAMSGRFLRELKIDNIIANLNCGSGSHATQTAEMMVALEKLMIAHAAEIRAVLVYGDTNSSIAAALAASKLQIPVIHVEAGLRSFNRAMPEEINRVLVDHLSELLFCSSNQGVEQLKREGIDKPVIDVGDVMLDAFETFAPEALQIARPSFVDGTPFAIVTIHRPSNTDVPARLNAIINGLAEWGIRCVWPVHPRLRSRLQAMTLPTNIQPVEPLSYFEMLASLTACQCVVTDSGGLQKETYWAKKPCITARGETEWIETLENNWNQLWTAEEVPLPQLVATSPSAAWKPLYGDGTASTRIAEKIKGHFAAC